MVVKTSVEKPRTAEELAGLLREASASRSIVMPVGGGRARGMGGSGPGVDVELHTTRLDRMLEHSQADMVVSVEAGITLEALQHELGKARQFLPLDPFNSPGHTIGGLLATGWTGPLRLRYGSARDFLIGIRVALPDGKLASAGGRVVKNVSGYDLMKLHHGALGTLGVIVAASFKVFPKPLHDATVESDGGWLGAERALSMPVAPVAVEVFNDGRVLARFMGSPDAVKRALAELGWAPAPQTVWRDHSLRAPESWARISAPRHALRALVQALPPGAEWWASPGVGVAHWSIDSGPETVRQVRAAAEAAGGALVLMNAPAELVQTVGAWGSPPETLGVMRRLKDSFDPEGVLNRGRFLF